MKILQSTYFASDTLPAAVLSGISAELLGEGECRAFILRQIHQRACCPGCLVEIQGERAQASFWSGARVCCKSCGKYFDARTGTVLAGTTLDFRRVLLLALLFGAGVPVRQVADRLQLHESTVRDWRDRLSLGQLGGQSSYPIGEGTAPRRGEGEEDGTEH